jgi:hypothetical protein
VTSLNLLDSVIERVFKASVALMLTVEEVTSESWLRQDSA